MTLMDDGTNEPAGRVRGQHADQKSIKPPTPVVPLDASPDCVAALRREMRALEQAVNRDEPRASSPRSLSGSVALVAIVAMVVLLAFLLAFLIWAWLTATHRIEY